MFSEIRGMFMAIQKEVLACLSYIVYIIYTMSFIRKIKRKGKVYLAEVENQWIDGRCVQKHIRYIGKEADGQTVLSSSISNVLVDEVKLYGPLLVLDDIAKEISLPEQLGDYGNEILSMVYAHCLDYKSINQMERWFDRTDLSVRLPLERLTERRLYDALDSIEAFNSQMVQQRIVEQVLDVYDLSISGIIYDVTNTYLYGKRCSLGKLGHDKEGMLGRPRIQIGLAVAKGSGIPLCHKVMDGNIHDARMFGDFVTDLRHFNIKKGMVVYDRGIASAQNIKDVQALNWDTLCGLPIKAALANMIKSLIARNEFIRLANRIRLRKNSFYAITTPYTIEGVRGTLAVCFNEQQKRELRESRYDEIEYAKKLLRRGKSIKAGIEKYFTASGAIREDRLKEAEEFDGYSCIFSTGALTKEEIVKIYFDKDVVEKAFRSIKGITRLQPVRHWLYNHVIAHVFICYLAYLLLSLLQYQLRKLEISAEEALSEVETMYKVYLRDPKKDFRVSRVVTLSKKQELILKAINRKLLKT
jgi:transposase